MRKLVHSYGDDKAVLTSDCGGSNMVMWADGGAGGTKSVIEEVPELDFFDLVPTVWDDTQVIHSEVGVSGYY